MIGWASVGLAPMTKSVWTFLISPMELVIAPEPKADGQARHGRRMAGRGALVDVVRLAGRAGHLLHEVVFLVRAAAGTKEGDALGAVLVADFRQPAAGERQGLFPRRLAKGRRFRGPAAVVSRSGE